MKIQFKAFGVPALVFIFAGPMALASGPDCITSVKIRASQSCDENDRNAAKDCHALIYSANTAFGEGGGMSTPVKLNDSLRGKIEQVKKIFADEKAKNPNRFSYCLDNVYYRGKTGYGREFTIEEFLDTMIEEQALREKKEKEELERQARIKKLRDETIDFTPESGAKSSSAQ